MDQPFVLPGYTLTGLLGFGGTGEVWRGTDELTGEPVALKRLWEPAAPELVARLRREAMLVNEVAGRHGVSTHDVKRLANGDVVIVMEYAAGGSLGSLLARRTKLTPEEVVTVLAPLARVLGAAHQSALWHGDLTPSNVVFAADGRPKLCDFGLALTTGERPSDDPAYRDPALSAGWSPGPASDVFGLAAIAHAALTGVPPRPTDAMASSPRIADLAPNVPPALASAVEAAMSPDPDVRPDAATFAAAVLRSCRAAPVRIVDARRTTEPPTRATKSGGGRHRATRQRRTPRRMALTVVVFASVALSALTGAGWARLGPRPAAAQSSESLQPRDVAATALPPTPLVAPSPQGPQWQRIVAHLDFLRAQAWLAGDPDLLGKVYEVDASGVDLDHAELEVLADRGLRARGFSATVDEVAAVASRAGLTRLRVVDHLADYTIIDAAGQVVASRPGRTQTYFITVERVAGHWMVKAVETA